MLALSAPPAVAAIVACAARRARTPLALGWRDQSAQFSLRAATERGGERGNDEDKYLELLQLRDIKSEEFYEQQGKQRRYFYYIDLQGRLFLENTRPKNIATSLKSAKFLKFFFSQLRANDPLPSAASTRASRGVLSGVTEPTSGNRDAGHSDAIESSTGSDERFLEYPYRSPCGKEMNFIKCADRPFVFDDLHRDERSGAWLFAYGGGELSAPFDPEKLKISLSTGRLYHDIAVRRRSTTDSVECDDSRGIGIALIRSQLAVEFGRSISVFDSDVALQSDASGSDAAASPEGEAVGEFEWEGRRYPIHAID